MHVRRALLGIALTAVFGCTTPERTLDGTWKIGETKVKDGCAFFLKWAYVLDNPAGDNVGGFMAIVENITDTQRACSVDTRVVVDGSAVGRGGSGSSLDLEPGEKTEMSFLSHRSPHSDGRLLVLEIDSAESMIPMLKAPGTNLGVDGPASMPWTATRLTTCNTLEVTSECPLLHPEAFALAQEMTRLAEAM